jgi:hypothetical protein
MSTPCTERGISKRDAENPSKVALLACEASALPLSERQHAASGPPNPRFFAFRLAGAQHRLAVPLVARPRAPEPPLTIQRQRPIATEPQLGCGYDGTAVRIGRTDRHLGSWERRNSSLRFSPKRASHPVLGVSMTTRTPTVRAIEVPDLLGVKADQAIQALRELGAYRSRRPRRTKTSTKPASCSVLSRPPAARSARRDPSR